MNRSHSPLFSRALVLGALAGIALILIQVFSTRGPLILIPYGALFAALAPLLARYPKETFIARTGAGFVSFFTATLMAYAYIFLWANPGLPHVSFLGLVRVAALLAIGGVLASAVAFIVGDGRSERAA